MILLLFGIGCEIAAGIGGIVLIPLIHIFFAEIYLELSQSAPASTPYSAEKALEPEFHLG